MGIFFFLKWSSGVLEWITGRVLIWTQACNPDAHFHAEQFQSRLVKPMRLVTVTSRHSYLVVWRVSVQTPISNGRLAQSRQTPVWFTVISLIKNLQVQSWLLSISEHLLSNHLFSTFTIHLECVSQNHSCWPVSIATNYIFLENKPLTREQRGDKGAKRLTITPNLPPQNMTTFNKHLSVEWDIVTFKPTSFNGCWFLVQRFIILFIILDMSTLAFHPHLIFKGFLWASSLCIKRRWLAKSITKSQLC